MAASGPDAHAAELTFVMKDLLYDLQPLACRCISSLEESTGFIKHMLRVQIAAINAIQGLCKGNARATKYIKSLESIVLDSLDDRCKLDEIRKATVKSREERRKGPKESTVQTPAPALVDNSTGTEKRLRDLEIGVHRLTLATKFDD